ncbi:MAG: hypothetical protein P4L62_00905 [Candidatus Pacebacteria bacterium]|nr:hypothetical protein [Candidatus Paceibacterota bacterium]
MPNRKTIFLVLVFCGLFGLAKSSLAVPSISGFSGTVVNESSITISGSGFQSKATAKPLLWADFAEGNTNPSSLGQITSWDIAESPVLDSSPSIDCHSSHCMTSGSQFWYSNGGNGMAMGINPAGLVGTYGQQMYINFWRRIDSHYASEIQTSQGPNVKWLRIWGNDTNPPHGYPDTYTSQVQCDGGNPIYTEMAGSWEVWPGSWILPTTTWKNEEYIYKYNSAVGQANGVFDIQMNQIMESTSTNWQSDSSSYPLTGQGDIDIQDEFSPETCGSDSSYMPQSPDAVWYDGIYIDDTWQRVMICDSSTWASRTHCEIQIPSAWSDNGTAASITATANQGSFPDGSTAYLYVVDSTNTTNASGYPIAFGSFGSGTAVPNSPTGLSVE